ncbi:conserved proline rich protein [Mycobacterium tuberculosis SUMu012]|nr:conserved proline rich protein [Mycobacterium tuberculosis SUMu012]
MTETPQPAAPPPSAATTSPPPSPQQEKPPRLYRAAAWVVIVAGIVFTVAVIFFSGALVLGQGKCPYHRYYHHGMFRPVGPVAPGPGMGWVFGFPGGPLPQAWAPVSLEARVARLLVRLVRVPPPRRRAPSGRAHQPLFLTRSRKGPSVWSAMLA